MRYWTGGLLAASLAIVVFWGLFEWAEFMKGVIEKKEEIWEPDARIFQIGECEYVFWQYGHGSDMEHHAGCKNPIHEKRTTK